MLNKVGRGQRLNALDARDTPGQAKTGLKADVPWTLRSCDEGTIDGRKGAEILRRSIT